jgi:hypothetical protein
MLPIVPLASLVIITTVEQAAVLLVHAVAELSVARLLWQVPSDVLKELVELEDIVQEEL